MNMAITISLIVNTLSKVLEQGFGARIWSKVSVIMQNTNMLQFYIYLTKLLVRQCLLTDT